MVNIAIFVAITLAAAAAGQATHTHDNLLGRSNPTSSPPTASPYQRLFLVPAKPADGKVEVQVTPQASPRVIDMSPRVERGPCGMPIVVARPEVDPAMIITPPPQAKDAAKIRAVAPPPPCGK